MSSWSFWTTIEYFNTTLVKVHHMSQTPTGGRRQDFNTTLVKVHQGWITFLLTLHLNFNTTLVKVHPKNTYL